MKKWYRHPIVKTLLILTALVTPVIAALSFVLLAASPDTMSVEDMLRKERRPYEETDTFQGHMVSAIAEKLNMVDAAHLLETDGEYDPDKLIDVLEYARTEGYTDNDLSGLSYRLGDLVEWGRKANHGGQPYLSAISNGGSSIVVCEKTDGTYHYYTVKELKKLLLEDSLRVDGMDGSTDEKELFLEELENGYLLMGENSRLRNEEGELIYTEVWSFDGGQFEEKYAPEGAKDILSVVNSTPELNGKLTEIYNCLQYTIDSLYSAYLNYKDESGPFKDGKTNLTYLFVNEGKKTVYTNHDEFRNYEDVKKSLESIKSDGNMRYMIQKPDADACEDNLNLDRRTVSYWSAHDEWYTEVLGEDYLIAAAVDTSYPVDDIFRRASDNYKQYAPYVNKAAKAFPISIVLFLGAVVWLTVIAGRRAEEGNELYLHPFDRWKTELSAALAVIPWIFATMLLSAGWHRFDVGEYTADGSFYSYGVSMTAGETVVISAYALLTATCFLVGYLSLVRRIKGRTLWKDSILRMLYQWSKGVITGGGRMALAFWRQRRVLWKTMAAYLAFLVFQWFPVLTSWGIDKLPIFLMAAADIAAAVFLIRNALEKQQIKDGIKEIAGGSLDYKFPVKKFQGGDYQDMSKNLENIGSGLQNAVEKSMRDERLKTDLITNVSHDIKTPLTSIINYVDLLKRENFDDPKVKGYLDILEMKAQRLKTLTEDVVEASKVSSGSITLEFMDVDLVEMLNQTIGELSEKMEARQLTVVASLPEEPVIVHVDGRRMWRVLENIFNNAAKYAMPGTRVYADLKIEGNQTSFSLKNVSDQPLNFSSDELTERFIRGDVSRSTEGSGLGLSIAKSLTEMQGGKFELYLDGDLFKVTILFEKVQPVS